MYWEGLFHTVKVAMDRYLRLFIKEKTETSMKTKRVLLYNRSSFNPRHWQNDFSSSLCAQWVSRVLSRG
jgi:hypothetical protein